MNIANLQVQLQDQCENGIVFAQDYLIDNGYYVDAGIRQFIRKMLSARSKELQGTPLQLLDVKTAFVNDSKTRAITEVPEKANEQHYMVPPAFFGYCLGNWFKYSCCYYGKPPKTNEDTCQVVEMELSEAEENMLEIYCHRAQIENGMNILDLGCGWGSLSLYLAQKYPDCTITAVSNSSEQRLWINNKMDALGISNVQVITCDVSNFDKTHGKSFKNKFDTILSIEMFEHCKNWTLLLQHLKSYLVSSSKFGTPSIFIQTFCHVNSPYHFDDKSWMSRNFFSGGIMPSLDLINCMGMNVEQKWLINGKHYAKTSKQWLQNCDANKKDILALFEKNLTKQEAWKHYNRWRIFYIACEETFQFNNGQEWLIGHYRLTK